MDFKPDIHSGPHGNSFSEFFIDIRVLSVCIIVFEMVLQGSPGLSDSNLHEFQMWCVKPQLGLYF